MEHEEELLRLQLEDNKLGLEEAKLKLEEARVYLQDVADARAQQSAVQMSAAAPWYTKMVQPVLALFGVAVTFLLFVIFVYWAGGTHLATGLDGKQFMEPSMNPTQKDLVIYILGVLSAVVTQIFSYAYNGPGYRANAYDDQLRAAYLRLEQAGA